MNVREGCLGEGVLVHEAAHDEDPPQAAGVAVFVVPRDGAHQHRRRLRDHLQHRRRHVLFRRPSESPPTATAIPAASPTAAIPIPMIVIIIAAAAAAASLDVVIVIVIVIELSGGRSEARLHQSRLGIAARQTAPSAATVASFAAAHLIAPELRLCHLALPERHELPEVGRGHVGRHAQVLAPVLPVDVPHQLVHVARVARPSSMDGTVKTSESVKVNQLVSPLRSNESINK